MHVPRPSDGLDGSATRPGLAVERRPRLARLAGRLGPAYLWLGSCLLTVLLLFALLNLLALGTIAIQTQLAPHVYRRWLHPREVRQRAERAVLAPLSAAELEILNEETWHGQPWQYDPWVVFRERPRAGTFVNVSAEGFRAGGPGQASLSDPVLKVFVFGGSTTFGYGVPDSWTFPAHLQAILSERYPDRQIGVFNFGRANYYSAQELALLLQLLRQGHRPDVAIFVDGLNEGRVSPAYAEEMSEMFNLYNEPGFSAPLRRLLDQLPVLELARRLRGADPFAESGQSRDVDLVFQHYLHCKELIRALGQEVGFPTWFYIQPVPGFRNAFLRHPLASRAYVDAFDDFVQPKMELLRGTADGRRSFDMTGLLAGYSDQPFVDGLHYSSPVNRLLAGFIADTLELPSRDGAGGRAP